MGRVLVLNTEKTVCQECSGVHAVLTADCVPVSFEDSHDPFFHDRKVEIPDDLNVVLFEDTEEEEEASFEEEMSKDYQYAYGA